MSEELFEFQERVGREKNQNTDFLETMSNRRDQLRKFLSSNTFKSIPSRHERTRLRNQLIAQNEAITALDKINTILDERIENFGVKIDVDRDPVSKLTARSMTDILKEEVR